MCTRNVINFNCSNLKEYKVVHSPQEHISPSLLINSPTLFSLTVVSTPGSCRRRSGLPGWRPPLCVEHKERDGRCHAHHGGRHGERSSGHPGPALRQRPRREEETSRPRPSSGPRRDSTDPRRQAGSLCEEEETSSTHNPFCSGAAWCVGL